MVAANKYNKERIWFGLAILVLGNLVWRIVCKGWILIFNIYDYLSTIDVKMGQLIKANASQAQSGESLTNQRDKQTDAAKSKDADDEKSLLSENNVRCVKCKAEIELDKDDIDKGFYICPQCGEKNTIKTAKFRVSKYNSSYVVCLNCLQENYKTYMRCQKCGAIFIK